jgi:ubiquinone/menaquinone biosynthesis C-methylase UbiE
MVADALTHERDAWIAAGFVPGARIADIGCGPAAVLLELAKLVGSAGNVVGVERDPEARGVATDLVTRRGFANVRIVSGEAEATGLDRDSCDAIMMRHVLLHNGPRASAILAHISTLLRPGGSLYLVETDPLGWRRDPDDPDTFIPWYRAVGRRPARS